jgi:hypothetical protein
MFRCERCGSEFSPIRMTAGAPCPRCRARDGVSVPLSFAPFSANAPEADDGAPSAEPSRDEGVAQAELRRLQARVEPACIDSGCPPRATGAAGPESNEMGKARGRRRALGCFRCPGRGQSRPMAKGKSKLTKARRSKAGKKAATTRKLKAAGRKGAATRKLKTAARSRAGKKAAATRRKNEAGAASRATQAVGGAAQAVAKKTQKAATSVAKRVKR